MSKFNVLTGTRVIEEVDSPINGKVRVVQSFGWGNSVQAGNLTQSGGVVRDVWKYSLNKVKASNFKVSSCLILGLGGGSCARLIKKNWPSSKIVGVELDPIMVDMGMKYLGLGEVGVDIRLEDAERFCKNAIKNREKYDLVLVDMYVGEQIPQKFDSSDFIFTTKNLMEEKAKSVFNRLYFGEKRGLAESFRKKLESSFSEVVPVYPEANVMFICSQ
jgi:spermidine synthase